MLSTHLPRDVTWVLPFHAFPISADFKLKLVGLSGFILQPEYSDPRAGGAAVMQGLELQQSISC